MRVNSVKSYSNKSNKMPVTNNPVSFSGTPLRALQEVQKSTWLVDFKNVDILGIQKYLSSKGIQADFSEGNIAIRKFVARSTEITTAIFDRLGIAQPRKVMTLDFKNALCDPNAGGMLGLTTNAPLKFANGKIVPVRTVAFNVMNNAQPEEYLDIIADAIDSKHFSTPHFLHPFVHEYAHSALTDNVFKRYGAHFQDLSYKTNVRLRDSLAQLDTTYNNPRTKEAYDIVKNQISIYATNDMHETFAEGLTKKILTESVNLFPHFEVKPLKFDPYSKSDQILLEIWKGLISDGKGLV